MKGLERYEYTKMPTQYSGLPVWQTYARGKLLLTGEYAVLDGALALALPVRYGQTLTVTAAEAGWLRWEARDEAGNAWFEAEFTLPDLATARGSDMATADTLRKMLLACRAQRPDFLQDGGYQVVTALDFPRNWGLGSSSTLIAALARWAGVDPYPLLAATLGGSGYDLACAYVEGPLLYQRQNDKPVAEPVIFQPPFADCLHFVFLGKKQNSREGIQRYRALQAGRSADLVVQISELTAAIAAATDLKVFATLLETHENCLSEALNLPRAQTLHFPDFPGVVKSLGAWGGDFVLVVSELDEILVSGYFNERGFAVCIPYREMVL